ncbi:MAG TPA: hypothetical protein VGN13_12505 [Solirubrobacteraceae bacterium]
MQTVDAPAGRLVSMQLGGLGAEDVARFVREASWTLKTPGDGI